MLQVIAPREAIRLRLSDKEYTYFRYYIKWFKLYQTYIQTYILSLYNVIVLVFHSRVGTPRAEKFVLNGKFEFISEAPFVPGTRQGNYIHQFQIYFNNLKNTPNTQNLNVLQLQLVIHLYYRLNGIKKCAFMIESTRRRSSGSARYIFEF